MIEKRRGGVIMEEYIAAFDIGTTAVKGILVNKEADIQAEYSIVLDTYFGEEGIIEQDPNDWWQAVKEIAHNWWSVLQISPEEIVRITFSGQMEDVIPISSNFPGQKAILYSDTRAELEAEYILKKMPDINNKISNTIQASTPLAKLLWLKENNLELFNETERFVFSSKDYIIYKLTGHMVTDPTTASTTGMMDLSKRAWFDEILETFGLKENQLAGIYGSEKIVGSLSKEAAEETGFLASTPVLTGSGDAGASTMGAAVVDYDDTYFYMGTTGWVANIEDSSKQNKQIDNTFNLAHLPDKSNIHIAPVLNAGNVHKWAVDTFIGEGTEDQFKEFDKLAASSPASSHGLLFLPYLNGERAPVSDTNAKGGFWGIGPKTQKSDLARSVVEGICFSYKQLTKLITDEKSKEYLTVIGGGTKSSFWNQVLADVLGRPIRIPEDSEYMTALGISATAFVNLGWSQSYNDFSEHFLIPVKTKTYNPNPENFELYKKSYHQYLKLYPNLKGMYN